MSHQTTSISKEKTFSEAPPWEGKEDENKEVRMHQERVSILERPEGRTERRRTEVERNMNMRVDKERVRRT